MRFQTEFNEIACTQRAHVPMKSLLMPACWLSLMIPSVTVRAADSAEPAAFQVSIEVVEVLDDGEEKVQDRHLVLFQNGKAYDFGLLGPHDVTVVDPNGKRVILLSRESHVKSTLSSDDLTAAAARVRAFASDLGKEDRLGINAQPARVEADADGDPAETHYQVEFSGVRYQAVGVSPDDATQPIRIAEFTDWAAKVNLIRKLGTPPFARMKLGHMIAADKNIPASITLRLQSGQQRRTFKSRYTLRDGLSEEDRTRLDKVAGMITLYSEVPLEAFPR